MKLMALDVGDKRIGVAVSDELLLTAQGKTVVKRTGTDKDIEKIHSLIKEYEITNLLVGMPLNMDGTLGEMADKTQDFIKEIQEKIDIPVETLDERLTTKFAENTLLEADVSRQKRKQVVDKLAAVNILQTYLDSRKKK